MGYDFLALRVLLNRGHITGVGRMIGMGKESDIYEVRCVCVKMGEGCVGVGMAVGERKFH